MRASGAVRVSSFLLFELLPPRSPVFALRFCQFCCARILCYGFPECGALDEQLEVVKALRIVDKLAVARSAKVSEVVEVLDECRIGEDALLSQS